MTVLCPTCHGRGSIPDPSIVGPMWYYDPNTGPSWPMVICCTCGGTGWVWVPDAARVEPVAHIETVWESQCSLSTV